MACFKRGFPVSPSCSFIVVHTAIDQGESKDTCRVDLMLIYNPVSVKRRLQTRGKMQTEVIIIT